MTNNLNETTLGFKVIMDKFNSVQQYTRPTKFRVSINTPDVTISDSVLTTTVPISGTETIDDCSSITGWTASGTNSVSVNAVTFKPDSGTDGALNIIKSDGSSTLFTVSKTTTSVDGTAKDFIMWFYIKDATAYAKLTTTGATTCLRLRFGSDASNFYFKNYFYTDLVIGWNFIKIVIPSGFGSSGSPVITTLNYTYITVVTNNNADTFAAGDIVFDSIRVASADDYYKTFDSVTIDETNSSVTTVSKLSVTEANGFLLNGIGHYNTDATEKLVLDGKFTANSKDATDLFKLTVKLNFVNIT